MSRNGLERHTGSTRLAGSTNALQTRAADPSQFLLESDLVHPGSFGYWESRRCWIRWLGEIFEYLAEQVEIVERAVCRRPRHPTQSRHGEPRSGKYEDTYSKPCSNAQFQVRTYPSSETIL